MCVSTPRLYARSGYFLVTSKSQDNYSVSYGNITWQSLKMASQFLTDVPVKRDDGGDDVFGSQLKS